jgi:hypothetical protein
MYFYRTRNKIPSESLPPAPFFLQVTFSRCRHWAHALLLRDAHCENSVCWPDTHCEISRCGDKYTSFWWHTRHAVRNSVSGIVRFRYVVGQSYCEELRKSGDTYTSVWWPARYIVRNSTGVAIRELPFGDLPATLWGALQEWRYVHVRLVAWQTYCEEICRSGDTYTSVWWPARHIVRKSAGVAIRSRPFGGLPDILWGTLQEWWYVNFLSVACQTYCEEICRSGDTYTSVWCSARYIVRNSTGVVIRKLPFGGLPDILWGNLQEWWLIQFLFAACQARWGTPQESWYVEFLLVARQAHGEELCKSGGGGGD